LCKALVTSAICKASGLSFANAQQVGLLVCQAGEFAFVIFGIAREVGVFSAQEAKLLLTVTSVSMACTPLLSRLGQDLRRYLQERKENKGTKSVDMACQVRERLESARVVICGYGRVGTLVAQLLDTKFVPWVAFDVNERIVAEARAKDLPVFLGDVPDLVASATPDPKERRHMDARKVAVVTPADTDHALRAVRGLRLLFPELSIVARATTASSARSIRGWKAQPIVPGQPEDVILMNLPLGATVLQALGCPEASQAATASEVGTATGAAAAPTQAAS